MTHSLVVNIDDEDCDVRVDRTSKWGNPFSAYVHGREDCIRMYKTWFFNSHLRFELQELTGKTLGCHCAPKPCHAEVLAHMANTPFLVDALARGEGPYRVIVCGSRRWRSVARIRWTLITQVKPWLPHVVLVHGDAEGADRIAGSIAHDLHWPVEVFPADWKSFGRAAGPIRNSLMVATDPVVVFAFGNSGGTNNCIQQARDKHLHVIRRHFEWPISVAV